MLKPIFTEQSMKKAIKGWYTFAVNCSLTKPEIVKLTELQFGVKVTDVRTAIIHGKIRRVGKKMKSVKKSDWKKALVKVKDGQKIDAFQLTEKES